MVCWEIGSEFEYDFSAVNDCASFPSWLCFGEDQLLTFSGRTSIDFVLDDIKIPIKACVPSYCCESMLAPFRMRGIPLSFYAVDFYDVISLDFSDAIEACNVLLIANYFGYKSSPFPAEVIQKFRANGGIVIYDATHSLFIDDLPLNDCDYVVASLRKWGPLLSGGLCCKMKGVFVNHSLLPVDDVFLTKKRKAMQEKFNYLQGDYSIQKKSFLNFFAETNHQFEMNYQHVGLDSTSLSILNSWNRKAIQQKRCENASLLNAEISQISKVRPLQCLSSGDCPLFFPIIIENGKRDKVRKYLVQNNIYCTVHWPHNNEDFSSNIFAQELSLTCDQRYDADDMNKVIHFLKKSLMET